MSSCDTALSFSKVRVEIAQALICEGELSATIVVPSEAVAAPLPCSPNGDISALAGLNVGKLRSSASQSVEKAAVAEL